MNPLMKERQILKMISTASSLKENDGKCLYWLDFKYPIRKHTCLSIPSKKESYASFGTTMDETRTKAVGLMFDLAMHHYISNVKRFGRTMEVRFKECRGGREPNFGARTIQKIVRIIEKACVPEDPF